MTVIVSVKINDGIVMAADSATSFANGMSYQHANKIVNLKKGLPIGAMVTGSGGVGNESIDTLLKDLRRRFNGEDAKHLDWEIDPQNFTMAEVAEKTREFIFCEKISNTRTPDIGLLIRLCGYSSDRPLAETWDVRISGENCEKPMLLQAEDIFGPHWEGEQEALNRMILGVGGDFVRAAEKFGLPQDRAIEAQKVMMSESYSTLTVPAMPIQDAIDLAKFLVETTIGFVKFSFLRPVKTVGGPIEIAAITKHEGFKWVQRKHFFRQDIN